MGCEFCKEVGKEGEGDYWGDAGGGCGGGEVWQFEGDEFGGVNGDGEAVFEGMKRTRCCLFVFTFEGVQR